MKFLKDNLELIFWLSGLLLLLVIKTGEAHFTICPLATAGLTFCPGCGLGSSISYLLRLQLLQSFNAHPLGIVAFFIITNRIITLYKLQRKAI